MTGFILHINIYIRNYGILNFNVIFHAIETWIFVLKTCFKSRFLKHFKQTKLDWKLKRNNMRLYGLNYFT